MNEFVVNTAKDWTFNKALQWAERNPYVRPFIKPKLLGTIAETEREYHEYIVKPQLESQFGITPNNPKPIRMPYTYNTAFRNRLRGAYPYKGGRRLTAKRAITLSPPAAKRQKGGGSAVSSAMNIRARVDELGERVGTSNCRKTEVFHNAKLATDTTLESTKNQFTTNRLFKTPNLLRIDRGDGIHQRNRDVVNLRGFHIVWNCRNAADINSIPWNTTMHMALIAPKTKVENVGQLKTDFFRHYISNRARDFNSADQNQLSGLEMDNNPINTDLHQILFHKKFNMNNRERDTGTGNEVGLRYTDMGITPNMRTGEMWVPVNRQIRYNNILGENSTPADQVFLVFWFVLQGSLGASGGSTPSFAPDTEYAVGTMFFQAKIVAYWRESET